MTDEDKLERHERALERIGNDLDTLKRDVHEMKALSQERHSNTQSLKVSFYSILAVGIMQFTGTVWWAATMNEGLRVVSAQSHDHELRLRATERGAVPSISVRP